MTLIANICLDRLQTNESHAAGTWGGPALFAGLFSKPNMSSFLKFLGENCLQQHAPKMRKIFGNYEFLGRYTSAT
jgi:hypothetical protein